MSRCINSLIKSFGWFLVFTISLLILIKLVSFIHSAFSFLIFITAFFALIFLDNQYKFTPVWKSHQKNK